ncbi:hypothetical protein DDQ68_17290 [Hymenobacter nivis]|uniref:Uncharacterized protein n=1 Tax=Hymenobacter nivis TaxID=1850093 RepID=A0A2Z3GTK7_9BACT|nr:hypothetical protein DDQ68_17290 [Hymenobacter nivis]
MRLALLYNGEFSVIKSLLTPESMALWQQQALGLAGAAALTWATRPGTGGGASASAPGYAGAALVAYGALLWLGTHDSDH